MAEKHFRFGDLDIYVEPSGKHSDGGTLYSVAVESPAGLFEVEKEGRFPSMLGPIPQDFRTVATIAIATIPELAPYAKAAQESARAADMKNRWRREKEVQDEIEPIFNAFTERFPRRNLKEEQAWFERELPRTPLVRNPWLREKLIEELHYLAPDEQMLRDALDRLGRERMLQLLAASLISGYIIQLVE